MVYYGFCNYYLSSIQQGIQNAHVITKISVKYTPDTEHPVLLDYVPGKQYEMYRDWASNHYTMCCLNGGNSKDLNDLILFFISPANPYPWSAFYEDEQSLDGALTAVGIVLPESIYETAKAVRERRSKVVEVKPGTLVLIENAQEGIRDVVVNTTDFSQWELQLIQKLPSFPLAK